MNGLSTGSGGEMERPSQEHRALEGPDFARREFLRAAAGAAMSQGLLGKLFKAAAAIAEEGPVHRWISNPDYFLERLCSVSHDDCQMCTFFDDNRKFLFGLEDRKSLAWANMIWEAQGRLDGTFFGMSHTEMADFKRLMLDVDRNSKSLIRNRDKAWTEYRKLLPDDFADRPDNCPGCATVGESNFVFMCEERAIEAFIADTPKLAARQVELRLRAGKWAQILRHTPFERVRQLMDDVYDRGNGTFGDFINSRRGEVAPELSELKLPMIKRFPHWTEFSGQRQYFELLDTHTRLEALEAEVSALKKEKEAPAPAIEISAPQPLKMRPLFEWPKSRS